MIDYRITCPHCKTTMEIDPNSATLSDGYENTSICVGCGKPITITTNLDIKFTVSELSCEETGSHNFNFITGIPKYEFYNKVRCENCGDVFEVEDVVDRMPELLGSYYPRWERYYIDYLLTLPEFINRLKGENND